MNRIESYFSRIVRTIKPIIELHFQKTTKMEFFSRIIEKKLWENCKYLHNVLRSSFVILRIFYSFCFFSIFWYSHSFERHAFLYTFDLVGSVYIWAGKRNEKEMGKTNLWLTITVSHVPNVSHRSTIKIINLSSVNLLVT